MYQKMRFLKYVLIVIPFSFLWMLPHKEVIHKTSFNFTPALQYADDSARIVPSNYCKTKNNHYYINDTIDLQGKTWYLPDNITLCINGGLLKNGAVVGNNTALQYKGVIFNRVQVKGTWIVPQIKTSMFADLSYKNSLKDVFALANPKIKNKVFVETGNYCLSALKNHDRCLRLPSNMDVTINGTLILAPNSFEEYTMIFINGNNITLHGNGSIVGDKQKHLGSRGEWGMGIYIHESNKVKMSDITVKDCWGDCVYIGGGSKDIYIEKCILDNGRRQGISVTSAANVYIRNCTISNVGGTSPQYAIDLEPNAGNVVENVMIYDVKSLNCQGGIMSHGRAKDAKIGLIKVCNTTIEGAKLCPLYFEKGKNVTIEKCILKNNGTNFMIVCNDIDSVRIENNSIVTNNKRLLLDKTISVNNFRKRKLKNNVIKN